MLHTVKGQVAWRTARRALLPIFLLTGLMPTSSLHSWPWTKGLATRGAMNAIAKLKRLQKGSPEEAHYQAEVEKHIATLVKHHSHAGLKRVLAAIEEEPGLKRLFSSKAREASEEGLDAEAALHHLAGGSHRNARRALAAHRKATEKSERQKAYQATDEARRQHERAGDVYAALARLGDLNGTEKAEHHEHAANFYSKANHGPKRYKAAHAAAAFFDKERNFEGAGRVLGEHTNDLSTAAHFNQRFLDEEKKAHPRKQDPAAQERVRQRQKKIAKQLGLPSEE